MAHKCIQKILLNLMMIINHQIVEMVPNKLMKITATAVAIPFNWIVNKISFDF